MVRLYQQTAPPAMAARVAKRSDVRPLDVGEERRVGTGDDLHLRERDAARIHDAFPPLLSVSSGIGTSMPTMRINRNAFELVTTPGSSR